jgi:hypothetical protein
MSSKEEIKTAFMAELMTTPQYQIVLKIKQLILDEIARPNINQYVVYNYETPQNREEQQNIKMCMILEFGFSTENISENSVVINMMDFLK